MLFIFVDLDLKKFKLNEKKFETGTDFEKWKDVKKIMNEISNKNWKMSKLMTLWYEKPSEIIKINEIYKIP
jgi:hypothetical protein